MAASKREQLIETALSLFNRVGYHATGIDRILAESGVAKMTLYNHFKSKDELIVAALESRFGEIRQRLDFAREHLEPRAAVLGAFDGLQEWLKQDDFCGCLFLSAAAEFSDRAHPVHQQAAEQKRFFARYFEDALQRLGVAQPGMLARQLQFLFEGAVEMAHLLGPDQQAAEAKAAALVLLDAARAAR
ncbi:TetR/AcrR family transcriptional regulator [Pseudomonas turukhanskensis]|uniref:TetR family transcriptional regulator n=1 Tax=Pseudomonas turukhanskensis TaxID=1806536 RepID=A0A9W6NHE6_9PSED|nr:TetR family transcriptional regulator [Pseudomonas turukhanskensis]GLK90671.1 TetR family transcriptional regulator [Pseudomonas turukhanskensis]